jgi:predicted nucleic acid-binding protein
MALLVDTSVWSLALRRDGEVDLPEVSALKLALLQGGEIITTGFILQELLQGFLGPKARTDIIDRFAAIPFISPARDDHIAAADLRNHCRRHGVQVGTVDAILAYLAIKYDLTMLATDKDFKEIARHTKLQIWSSPTRG